MSPLDDRPLSGLEGVLRPGHGGLDAVDPTELPARRRLFWLDAVAGRGEAVFFILFCPFFTRFYPRFCTNFYPLFYQF